ncbi:4a-hydroxytetrahydrobiopterin dehydratase [Streptomyces sp. DvalAA-14]|uniref:4a-hydroxytetrahydrobiopterin dehydratase n=1 Tax=unclassified Streptomyces TaxID=2593676 RepID=UPI00081B8517|nr:MULTISPECIES: 4a-hydroxytetrahydrobiopterin dehydratase [unclassified Streptomyces]MYS24490.1 4a-hydroxytetrahydrobiopterin dehydratase [Streptomyces sp. SID4948]SCE46557.1 4a-hydroxytetrahydrobiopterin dehydratase [Streptomyces sp. DvalAA-14]
MATTPLTEAELDQALSGLPGWTVTGGALSASFTADRAVLPGLYAAVAAAEDEADHHAEIRVLYGTVTFALNTHDAGGAITAKDTALAARISGLAADYRARPAG